jgi:TolB-like protein/tRNA A-37 threonylcarbamoyl transferase component Bud32
MEGRQLGSYRIASLLGSGGMGDVYRAYDEKLRRDVAIKVLRAADADDGAARALLLREARAAAAVNHPNICTIHEVGEHDGLAFLAMELVDGEPLHRVIPPGTGLPVDRMVDYSVQVADALAHAHERGVLHRDLKAQNIVITRAGRAKVLDFGLAKRVVTSDETTTEMASVFTAAGAIAGTPAYMSPEQLRGLPADPRSDVWALGVVLHEMAAGARPFAGQTPYELSAAILNTPAPALPSRVPPELQSVIARCLEKDPDARFQSAGDVRAALESARSGRPSAAAGQRAPKTWPVVWRGAAALLLLALAAAVMLNVGALRDRFLTSPPLFDSVAVLPLTYTGSQDDAYLAGGIQQELINELALLPGFSKVIAAASTRRFLNSGGKLPEIGSTLGVRAFVTGSVVRTVDGVQVAAQLIDAADQRQVWGQTFERPAGDLVALQNDVAASIAQAIEVRLRPADRQRLAARATINPATYELYLRGMHELSRVQDGGDRNAGLTFLQQAIDQDPGDPHAYAGLAKGYVALGHSPVAPEDAWIRARAAAERALTLAPDLADAHAAMAEVKLYYEWDWPGAERLFRRANELNPNLAQNHYHYAWFLALHHRLEEAIVEHERARDLDPMTPANTAWLGMIYAIEKRYDEAIAAAQKVIEMYPRSGVAWQVLGFTYSAMGRHDDAIAANQRAAEYAPPWTFTVGIAYAQAGRMDEARAVLQTMLKRPATAYSMWARAMLALHIGDADQFFTSIAFTPHHAFAPWVCVEAPITRFKDDPRYSALFARFKLSPPPR